MPIYRAWLLAAAMAAAPALAAPATRIFTGGPILTMNDAAMRAEALAEENGRIVAVGSAAKVMALKGPKTEVIDLKGQALLPGFVDGHGHVMGGGMQALSANLLPPPDGEGADIPSLQRVLKQWMADNADAVTQTGFVIGFGYDDSQLKEQRHPTREDLDAVTTRYPVILIHQSGHIGAMNSKALALVGYTAATPDPDGGLIRRQPGSREPNGVAEEAAHFNALYKLLPMAGPQGFKAFTRAGARLWASFGYTTGQEGRATPGVLKLLRQVADEGGLPVDVAAYSDILDGKEQVLDLISPTYTNHMRIAGYKLTIDGSPQGFTAWRDRPYYKPVGNYPPGYSGYAAVTEKQVFDALDYAYAHDKQILVHSNGERSHDVFIAATDTAEKRYGKGDRRPVLVHGQFEREDQMDSFKRLGIFPSLFPMHTFYWGDWHRDHTVGPVAAENISPTGWALQRGMMFSTHHDAPVAFPDSMRVLDATVTRRSRSGDIIGPAHRVDVITALKAMTIWPAWQHFEEKDKGSLEVGKRADLVILSRDPTAVDPETLDQLKVMATIKDGQTVYTRPARAASLGHEKAGAMLLTAFAAGRPGAHAHGGHGSPDDIDCVSEAVMALGDAMARGGR